MAAAKKKPDVVEWDGPEWVLPEDRDAYDVAYADGELDSAGFGSREEYEGRSEMDAIAAEADDKPEPKPGDADYDWSAHYPADAKLFRHTLSNGKVIAIREFGAIYSKGWLYKIRNFDSDVDFQFAAIDRAACETVQTLIASVDTPVDSDADPFDELWSAWVAAATSHDGEKGMTPGE